MRYLVLFLPLVALLGCSIQPGKNPDPVEVSGRITMSGKPVSDVILNFQPTGSGAQATLPVKNGSFQGSVMPGKYTYYLSEGRNPAALDAVPEKYRSGALDRQIDISGGALELTLN